MASVNPNEAGRIHIARVSLPEAVAFDPETDDPNKPESWPILEAKDYDPDKHSHMHFFCPCCMDKDKDSQVRLNRPSKESINAIPFEVVDPQTNEVVVDDDTGEPMLFYRRWKIPPRYSTARGQTHECDLGDRQSNLSQSVRNSGGVVVNSETGTYIVNLAIPAGQKAAPWNKPRVSLANIKGFDDAATPGKYRIHRSSRKPASKRSEGVMTVEGLAELLDNTQFGGDRENILLRNGPQGLTLEEIYHDNAKGMYRALYVDEKAIEGQPSANHDHIALFHFKPNGNRSFWKKQPDSSMTVPSPPERITSEQGVTFYVTTHLNFQTDSAYQAFLEEHRNADKQDRSFLVYTENATVNLQEYKDQRAAVRDGEADHATVHVHATVFDAAQMMQWAPQSPQLLMNFDSPDQPLYERRGGAQNDEEFSID